MPVFFRHHSKQLSTRLARKVKKVQKIFQRRKGKVEIEEKPGQERKKKQVFVNTTIFYLYNYKLKFLLKTPTSETPSHPSKYCASISVAFENQWSKRKLHNHNPKSVIVYGSSLESRLIRFSFYVWHSLKNAMSLVFMRTWVFLFYWTYR